MTAEQIGYWIGYHLVHDLTATFTAVAAPIAVMYTIVFNVRKYMRNRKSATPVGWAPPSGPRRA